MSSTRRKPDIGFLPTPLSVVDAMLELAEVSKDDCVYDLGSGDGRILIAAAQRFGVKGVGIDIDGDRVREAVDNTQQAGVAHLVSFHQQDLYACDFQTATVVILYLLPHLNLKLRPALLQLKPGTRVISHDFDMGDWIADQTVRVPIQDGEIATVYRWTIDRK